MILNMLKIGLDMHLMEGYLDSLFVSCMPKPNTDYLVTE